MTRAHATRRRASRRLAALAAALVAVLAVLSLTEASASTLTVTARKGVLDTSSRCTSTAVTVTPTTSGTQTTGVTVTGLLAADVTRCQGRTATVRLVGAAGQELAVVPGLTVSGSIVASGLALTTADVAAALVDVAGFAVPTTWSVPEVPVAGCYFTDAAGNRVGSCSVTGQDVYGVGVDPASGVRVLDVGIRTSGTPSSSSWRIHFTYRLQSPTVSGQAWSWADAEIISVQNAPDVKVTSTCGSLPWVSITDVNPYRGTWEMKIAENAGAYFAANPGAPRVCVP